MIVSFFFFLNSLLFWLQTHLHYNYFQWINFSNQINFIYKTYYKHMVNLMFKSKIKTKIIIHKGKTYLIFILNTIEK